MWFTNFFGDAEEDMTEAMQTELSVRNIQCGNGIATLALRNTGDRNIAGTASDAFLYWQNDLVDTASNDLRGKEFLTVNGFDTVTYVFPEMQANRQYRVEAEIDGVTVSERCRPLAPQVDGFEDGDIDEYVAFSGDDAYFTIQSDVVRDGSNALRLMNGDSEYRHLYSYTGLPSYPSQGDTFSVWVRSNTTDGGPEAQAHVMFGKQDNGGQIEYYRVQVMFNDGNFLLKVHNASGPSGYPTLAEDIGAFTYPGDAWYLVQVDWMTNGTIVSTLYDEDGAVLSRISATDTQYGSGGVGPRGWADSGTAVYWDNYHVHE